MRALVVAHGHPDFGAGGGEIAAYGLFRALRAHPGVEAADFLARTAEPRLVVGGVGRLRENEYLVRRDTADWLRLAAAPDEARAGRRLPDLLAALRPDAVFVHHVAHLGLGLLGEIRASLPAARIVLTLHDFLGICAHRGLMVTAGEAPALCEAAAPERCRACLPSHPTSAFAERRRLVLAAFARADRFVAPSRFLAGRYRDWGLPLERLAVIANGTEPAEPLPLGSGEPLRLGMFGQLRPEKGLHVLLAALHHLAGPERARLRLVVSGSRLEAQDGIYRELVRRLAEPLEGEGVLSWRGAYGRGELAARMAEIDLVAVPSTWWENAPLVIGEAFAHGRPVLAIRRGGMAEMVRDGVDGLLVDDGGAPAFAAAIRRFLADPELARGLARGIRPPPTPADMAETYLALARGIA
ncbi:glycosyltransferase [Antarcticirhabdus aurantiaca]|uniref:Glycosyltransferase n=1 Tax=Antarcticirhabdus aurantiaca TaxID=2606717 RepID=A0ACD4NKK5_9HYPH|nr:glycosyltransferase [Antarcticirhabdus aurantiaca]WAJ27462.1 glycosyltransferase [Jeongeuplla avenae]